MNSRSQGMIDAINYQDIQNQINSINSLLAGLISKGKKGGRSYKS